MKKILTLIAFSAFVCTSSAISIVWGISGQAYYGSSTLLEGSAVSITLYYANGDFAQGSFNTVERPPTSQAGTFKDKGFGWVVDPPFNDSDNLISQYSQSFYVVLTTVQGGITYVNYSNIFNASGWANEQTALNLTFTFDYSTITANEWLGVTDFEDQPGKYQDQPAYGGGWYASPYAPGIPVPEPATAGLAFAGLALLFRRKRK